MLAVFSGVACPAASCRLQRPSSLYDLPASPNKGHSADANETAEAWRVALTQPHRPVAIVLSRQPLPTLDRTRYASAQGLRRGAYVLADPPDGQAPQVLLIATGSEVGGCIEAYERLTREGVAARVVSMPSWDIFERQDDGYKDSVLPPDIDARVAVEQAGALGWDRYVGRTGAKIVMHTFGASAPVRDLQRKFGFTPECVYDAAQRQIARTVATKGLPTGD